MYVWMDRSEWGFKGVKPWVPPLSSIGPLLFLVVGWLGGGGLMSKVEKMVLDALVIYIYILIYLTVRSVSEYGEP